MEHVEVRATHVESVVRRLASVQHGVVSTRQLAMRGIGARRLRALFARGVLDPVSRSVFRLVGTPVTPHQAALAAVLDAPPGALASHQTAAALWNLPGFDVVGDLHVTVPRQGVTQRKRLAVVHFHQDLPMTEVVWRHAIPTASPTLAIFQLCAVVHPARAERAFDQASARGLTSGPRLAALVDAIGAKGRNGTRVARELVHRHGDQPVPESGLEVRVEWLGGQAGLALDRQVVVGRDAPIGRADFRVRGTTGLIEAQSLLYHSSPMGLASDQLRISGMLAAGFSVLTVWDYQAFHQPAVVVDTFRQFHARLLAGDPPFHLDCPDR